MRLDLAKATPFELAIHNIGQIVLLPKLGGSHDPYVRMWFAVGGENSGFEERQMSRPHFGAPLGHVSETR